MPNPIAQKDVRRLADKQAHVAEQMAMFERNRRIVRRIGGTDTVDFGAELAFHQARADVLAWCETHAAEEIVARRDAVHATLGPDGVAAKGGNMIGLPRAVVALIAEAELLDLALGE